MLTATISVMIDMPIMNHTVPSDSVSACDAANLLRTLVNVSSAILIAFIKNTRRHIPMKATITIATNCMNSSYMISFSLGESVYCEGCKPIGIWTHRMRRCACERLYDRYCQFHIAHRGEDKIPLGAREMLSRYGYEAWRLS